MKTSKYILAAVLILTLAVPAYGQFNNAGTSVANFLKIPVGARGAALGGALTATSNDATSLFWNVAGIANLERNEVSFNTNNWLIDLQHHFAAGAFTLGMYDRIGISVSYLDMGEMEQTTVEQTKGTGIFFNAYDVAFGVAYARKLTDQFNFGVQAKYINETISKSTASGLGFDVGIQYHGEWNNLQIGAAITNFGSSMKIAGDDLRIRLDPDPDTGSNPDDVPVFLETEAFSLPIQFQLGAAVTPVATDVMEITTMVDLRDSRDFNADVRLGAEIGVMDRFFVRAGGRLLAVDGSFFGNRTEVEGGGGVDFVIGQEFVNPTTISDADLISGIETFSLGAGINLNLDQTKAGFKADYAYSTVPAFGGIHRIGFAVNF